MVFFRRLLILAALAWVILISSGSLAFAQAFGKDDATLATEFSQTYKHVLVDARGSRGGNGDIAAAYLTINDWLINFQLESEFTVLVDQNGKTRLLSLAQGNELFLSKVRVLEETADAPSTQFSLYLVFANPSGTYRYASDLKAKFHFTENASFLVQTVLGNTENPNSLNPNAIVESKSVVYDWAPAGLSPKESGIYSDYIAQELRPLSLEQVRASLLENLHEVENAEARTSISDVLNQKKLQGAKVGLVYGISAEQTQAQFMSYLHGLVGQSHQSFVLFTPSSFKVTSLEDSLRERVVVLSAHSASLPDQAEPNKIYLVTTPNLPHRIFVSLMALSMKSGVAPVGAGDGFMSAAIDLGGPFVLTQVPWNRSNIANLKKWLLDLAVEYKVPSADMTFLRELLRRNYDLSDFRTAYALKRFAPLFRLLKTRIPKLSRRMLEMAVAAPYLDQPNIVPQVADLVLQKSVLKGGRTSPLVRTCQDVF